MNNTQQPRPRDFRRAAAMIVHHRRGSLAGVAVIAEEANADNRGPQLLNAVLEAHRILIGLLRTVSGINLIADWVHGMAAQSPDDGDRVDAVRAAQILDAHGRSDPAAIASVMNAATADGRATRTLLALLALYEVVVPELSSPGGLEWLTAQIPALAQAELDDGGSA